MLAFFSFRRFTAATFTKEQVLKPLFGRSYKNVFEMVSGLPEFGVGAKLWRRTWKADCFYTVTKVDFKDPHHGKIYGIRTWKGKADTVDERIHGCQKLAAWKYQPKDPLPVKAKPKPKAAKPKVEAKEEKPVEKVATEGKPTEKVATEGKPVEAPPADKPTGN